MRKFNTIIKNLKPYFITQILKYHLFVENMVKMVSQYYK